MAIVTTAEQKAFFLQFSRPPHNARMTDHAGRFIGRLDPTDADLLLGWAMEQFFQNREQIKETQDILRMWVKALEAAAKRRPYWVTYHNVYEKRKTKGSQLGRDA